jgi:hypothetical protein
MSEVVFILGAGASKECGAPLMKEFLDEAERLVENGGVSEDEFGYFSDVFKARGQLQNVRSKTKMDITNIESLFTALEVGSVIEKFPGLGVDEINRTINSLKYVIVRTLESSIKFPLKK